jgi:uncharacterized protein YutE (UPF0331/DUF86 family)
MRPRYRHAPGAPLARFRNALVHGSLRMDTALLLGVLNQHLDEVRGSA